MCIPEEMTLIKNWHLTSLWLFRIVWQFAGQIKMEMIQKSKCHSIAEINMKLISILTILKPSLIFSIWKPHFV